MTTHIPTRRAFLKVGALLATPMAAAVPTAARADDGALARLATLEDEAAIRMLHQQWLRQVNDGAAAAAASLADQVGGRIRRIVAEHGAAPDTIAIGADGRGIGRFHCLIETETELVRDCTLSQMAHAQGGGCIRGSHYGIIEATFAKTDGAWTLAGTTFAAA